MPRRVRTAGIVVLVLVLLAVAVVVGLRAWRQAHRTDLQRAIATAPADAQRFNFTDWAGVRRELDTGVDAASSYTRVSDFLDEAFDRDLSSTSALLDSTEVLQESFGFSPASVDWELFSQGQDGASIALKLPDDVDLATVGDTLEGLGYQRPDSTTGVWDGGPDLIARIGSGAGLNPELQYVALLPDQHLVVTSDTASYARIAVEAATGKTDTITGLDGVSAAAGDALSAAVYTGDDACTELAMTQTDESDQSEAASLVERAGKINPLAAFAMSSLADGSLRVAMGFEDADQARTNADSRAALASGPAVGQGGDFADRFKLVEASAQGDVVVLDLDPEPDTFVLSDLATGPVLYATC